MLPPLLPPSALPASPCSLVDAPTARFRAEDGLLLPLLPLPPLAPPIWMAWAGGPGPSPPSPIGLAPPRVLLLPIATSPAAVLLLLPLLLLLPAPLRHMALLGLRRRRLRRTPPAAPGLLRPLLPLALVLALLPLLRRTPPACASPASSVWEAA